MLFSHYIHHRNGSCRRIDYHESDPSDPPALQTMFAAYPPAQSIDLQIDTANEIVFSSFQSPQQVQAAFAQLDLATAKP